MTNIKYNFKKIRQKIIDFALSYGRNPKEITLLVVSKNKSADSIIEAIDSGQTAFGENYLQESIKKIAILSNYSNLEWHFIGALQSNKSRLVAENFSWLHTINSINIAQRVHNYRPNSLPPLNVLIQVNISKEKNKSGIMLDMVSILAEKITKLSRLQLRGLMAIPAKKNTFAEQLIIYQEMLKIFNTLKQSHVNIDTLSLGMSDDMEAAIAAGSTMLRIGKSIFDV